MAYLMDSITQTATMLRRHPTAAIRYNPMVTVYTDLADRLIGVPRFLLDDGAISAAVELSLGRPKVLVEALAHCRVPYPAMWVEWREGARERLHRMLREYGIEEVPGRPVPDRLGFLITSEEGGRRGRATWAWQSGEGNPPNIGCVEPVYDLDGQYDQDPERHEGFLRNNLVRLWEDNPVQRAALFRLWRTANHTVSDTGATWVYAVASTSGRVNRTKAQELVGAGFADVYGEYIILWAILLLLTADRKPVDYRPVNRTKLNKIRQRKGETPLLDHTEVRMHLTRPPGPVIPRGPLGHDRKAPRLHIVSRYLGHRGDKHWICEPYLRGRGSGSIHRVTHVKG